MSNSMDTEAAKKIPVDEVAHRLPSSANGLSGGQARQRLQQYGPNEIPEKKTNSILKFLGYFWGPIPWMIEIAVILSAIIGHWEDFAIILTLLIVNAAVGFGQEHQAASSLTLSLAPHTYIPFRHQAPISSSVKIKNWVYYLTVISRCFHIDLCVPMASRPVKPHETLFV